MSRATPREHRRASSGFTLIEVLVALAIVAAALAAIGSLIGTTARSTRSIEQHVALVETARALEAGLPERERLTIGDFSGESVGLSWRVDVLPFTGGGVPPDAPSAWVPHTVVITVRSPSGAVLRLDTVRLHRRSGG